jgi:hypothetical protein
MRGRVFSEFLDMNGQDAAELVEAIVYQLEGRLVKDP